MISDEYIRPTLSHGMSNIHVNTEIRIDYTNAYRQRLDENPNETIPYKYLSRSDDSEKKVA